MKKIASIVMAIVLVLTLSFAAFAADENLTITINNAADGHTYEAYQVFTGRLEGDTLSDIVWGSGVNNEALLAALKLDATIGASFADATTASQVAEIVEDFADDSAEAQAFAKVVGANLSATKVDSTDAGDTYTITGLDAGYYIVKDANTSLDGDNDAYTRYILEVVKNVNVTPKSSVPTVEKKVLEESYTGTDAETAAYGAHYNDVADYDIGDDVPFELIGTMPSTLVDYATYSYVFTDTLSSGLTFNNNAVVTVGGATVDPDDYTVAATANGFTVSFDDIKALHADDAAAGTSTGAAITVTAASKVFVNYTAELNANAEIGLDGNPNEVYLTYANNPNGAGTGVTPTDKVIVFTYELDVTKQSAEDAAVKLQGAQFVLYKTADETTYYATVADGKLTGWTTAEADATMLTSAENGLFTVSGLDDGTYALEEKVAPTGYNLLADPIEVVIDATTTNGQTWTTTAADAFTALTIAVDGGEAANGTLDTGIVAMTVENSTGSTLPSTGGMGTTIFTVTGISLMIAAAVIMIVRRKVTASSAA